jgi:methyl-accepting chemotaxis protein
LPLTFPGGLASLRPPGILDVALEGNVEHVKGVASASGHLREQAQTLRTAMSIFLVERN